MSLKVKNNSQTDESILMIGSDFSTARSLVIKHYDTTSPYATIGLWGTDSALTIYPDRTVDVQNFNSRTDGSISRDFNINRWLNVGLNNTKDDDNALYSYGAINLVKPDTKYRAKIFHHDNELRVQFFDESGTTLGTTVLAKQTSSQTITHQTNIVGEYNTGTFCEATGEIFDGYDKITSTDCICKVQTSNVLNKRIVGIICDNNTFASHGDVIVKVVPDSTYEIGDILTPTANGYGMKASISDMEFMMLNAIPRAKITSIIDSETVAAFLV